jgi:phage repressor protein C with HTH and peptisase S24 domain
MTSPQSSPRPKKPKLFLLRRVMGDSMAPTLVPGKVVLALPARKLKRGDIVIVHHEGLDKIKRIHDISFDKVFLTGDNPTHSTDSREFGWLPIEHVIGRLVWPRMTPAVQAEA